MVIKWKAYNKRLKDRKKDKDTLWLLTPYSDIIATYVIYCITKYNTPSDYNYWERRIYDFIPAFPKLRTTGTYPSVQVLRKQMIKCCGWKDLHLIVNDTINITKKIGYCILWWRNNV